MSTLHFRNAVILVDGYDLSGDHTSIEVAISAEMLDETSFGDSTRIHKGGLLVVDVNAQGNFDAAPGHIERLAYDIVGVDDKIITVFANGITEGVATDKGFSMKGVVDHYNLQGDVSSLLKFDMAVMGRGIQA